MIFFLAQEGRMGVSVRGHIEVSGTWACKRTLPLTHCVTLVMIHDLSGPQFLH